MEDVEYYRRQAEQARRKAGHTTISIEREAWLDIARSWQLLGDELTERGEPRSFVDGDPAADWD